MASRNAESTVNQGEFHATKPRDEPVTKHGHAVGAEQGKAAAPTFHAEAIPAGSAPADRTFAPNPAPEIPGQADNPQQFASEDKESTFVSAQDTIGGASSADVHKGLGHPGQGQVAADQKHGERSGMMGAGASVGGRLPREGDVPSREDPA